MQIVMKKLSEITPYAHNPRNNAGAVDAVARSIREFGFRNPVILDRDGVIVAGHTRALAAKSLGLEEVPCVIADDLTPEQVKAFRIADNKTAEIAEWDYELLPIELKELQGDGFDLSLLGFDTTELEQLLADKDDTVTEGETEADAVPDAPEVPVSRPGEVYVLGSHRLMCGDSTSKEDTAKLMGGGKAVLYLTDPPYNVALKGSTGLTIANDNMPTEQFRQFLDGAFGAAASVLEPGTSFYIFHSDSESANFRLAAAQAGLEVHETLYWVKNALVLGRFDYQYITESCQPAGTMVWTAGNKRVPIEQLKDGDEVMTFARLGGAVKGYKRTGYKVKTANRDYKGELVGVHVGEKLTWTTPEHRFGIRFLAGKRNVWCTYLMNKGRMWRVGMCQLFNVQGNGVKMRLKSEGGERAWILGTYDNYQDASAAEQGYAVRYGIPMTYWNPKCNGGGKNLRDLQHIYDIYLLQDMEGMEERAKALLERFHRDINYPLITPDMCWKKFNRMDLVQVRACNILPGLMEVILPYEKWDTKNDKSYSWGTIDRITHKHYEGKVYSLDVDKWHYYFADGIMTHNCLYGWTEGKAHRWFNDRAQTNALKFDKPKRNDVHPSMKPVEMLVYLVRNSSARGDVVLDNFGGSGSTLIACEQTGRQCRTMELDPKYCDVIRRRWAEFVHGEGCDWEALTPAETQEKGKKPEEEHNEREMHDLAH